MQSSLVQSTLKLFDVLFSQLLLNNFAHSSKDVVLDRSILDKGRLYTL